MASSVRTKAEIASAFAGLGLIVLMTMSPWSESAADQLQKEVETVHSVKHLVRIKVSGGSLVETSTVDSTTARWKE